LRHLHQSQSPPSLL